MEPYYGFEALELLLQTHRQYYAATGHYLLTTDQICNAIMIDMLSASRENQLQDALGSAVTALNTAAQDPSRPYQWGYNTWYNYGQPNSHYEPVA